MRGLLYRRLPVPILQVLTLLTGVSQVIFRCNAAPTDTPSAASFYVSRLPDLHQDSVHPLHIYAGHLQSDPNHATRPPKEIIPHLFFMMIKARRSADKERVVFWFNGGPGCSSFDGSMMEVGPWRIDGSGGLRTVEGGWEEYTTMIFVDQPAGTGLSYTSTDKFVHELDEAARQVVEFMGNFYNVFPELKSSETYLAGESYAGQFIPYIADAVLSSQLQLQLKGLAIGNGWFDGRDQYPTYLDFALQEGIVAEGSEDHKRGKEAVDTCQKDIDAALAKGPLPVSINSCEAVLGKVIEGRTRDGVNGQKMCMNAYDIRLEDISPACGMNWPADLVDIKKYLGRKDVVRALHAQSKSESWVECTSRVGSELTNRKSTVSSDLLPKLLDKLEILLFVGDKDFICNYVGIEHMINRLEWNGAKGLGSAKPSDWFVNGTAAGTWTVARNLTYVKVFNASHMVPYDRLHETHDMILRFMGVDFGSLADGSATIPSRVGNDAKPALSVVKDQNPQGSTGPVAGNKTPEQDKAMWEAYYNAGSAALVLILIALGVGLFFFCRNRRQRGGLSLRQDPADDAEERIPLSQSVHHNVSSDHLPNERRTARQDLKGKGRAIERSPTREPIFDVGDDEDEYHDRPR